jgi:hypothetical protein
MSGYAGAGQAQLLRTNQQVFFFNSETVTAPTASIAVQLERISRSSYPFGASFQLKFSGNPGTFEVDIQTSDTDLDADYCNINTWNSTASLNANYVGRIELPQFWAKFVRAYVKTLTNAVTVTVIATR